MKGIWIVPVIASVLILGTMGAQQVFAPDEKPEKLSLGGGGYNHSTESFELQLTSSYGMATAGEKAGFVISCTIDVKDALTGNHVMLLGPLESPMKKLDETVDPPRNEPVPLEPAIIPWTDRNFSGQAEVTAKCELQNPAGNTVAGLQTELTETMEIGDGSAP